MIEGYYKSREEIDEKPRDKLNDKKDDHFPEDYSKHIEIICSPQDMLMLAERHENMRT